MLVVSRKNELAQAQLLHARVEPAYPDVHSTSGDPCGGQMRAAATSEAGVPGDCELHTVGGGNRTRVLCRDSRGSWAGDQPSSSAMLSVMAVESFVWLMQPVS